MSFWSDASPVVKGTIGVGGVLLVYLGIAYFVNIFPFAGVPAGEVTQERGLR